MAEDKKSLTNLVNASGFVFQLAVANSIRSSGGHEWEIIAEEHPWHDPESDAEGFIDIVIKKGAVTFVIECKRSKEGSWVFLAPAGSDHVRRVRMLWVAGTQKKKTGSGWDDIDFLPPSDEARFCVVRGTGEGEKSLLERLASQLCMAADSLANEDASLRPNKGQDFYCLYVPVIVTNADIHICKLSPEKVSLATGNISEGDFSSSQVVRFRKSFSSKAPPNASAQDLSMSATERERTILVVSASSLVVFLEKLDIRKDMFDRWPWVPFFEQAQTIHK